MKKAKLKKQEKKKEIIVNEEYTLKGMLKILIVLLVDTFLLSYVIEWIKDRSGYNRLIEKVCKKSKNVIENIL